jgi:hypothetical protein
MDFQFLNFDCGFERGDLESSNTNAKPNRRMNRGATDVERISNSGFGVINGHTDTGHPV